MSAYEVSNLLLQFLTLIVLFATLLWVKKYTKASRQQVRTARDEIKLTADIATAAAAQAEAVLRPVVVVVAVQDHSDDSILEEFAALPVLPGPLNIENVQLRNVGAGPALNLRYQFHNPGYEMERREFVLAPGELLDTAFRKDWLKHESDLVIQYQSASDATYQTFATFDVRTSDVGISVARLGGQRVQPLQPGDNGSWKSP